MGTILGWGWGHKLTFEEKKWVAMGWGTRQSSHTGLGVPVSFGDSGVWGGILWVFLWFPNDVELISEVHSTALLLHFQP